ncbi:ABC transporter ATP-binding protein [Paenibacillus glycinis]|uniref:ATP-binding cassette domain-containing protein n=1 Tax=Paenibacillus glycinis TaxID=2697035 RepID=A0ABW9XLN4_9BACL|nr:ATP-binding cassette domain-containing protein [Paenibacillus glycinis]NBD23369.1 ATP-binding cassette domain-containing protein [Paenibacillus glycinis]
MSILAFTDLTKTVAGGRTLFTRITASVEEPESVALIAPSGQGKSTLLRLLALLDAPTAGELRLEGKAASGWQPQSWRRRAAYVAQQSVMLPGSVAHNLSTCSRLHDTPFDRELAARLMEAVSLSSTDWEKNADELSGGEKQRVSLVRSLLGEPAVLLLDEITASLDQHCKLAVEKLLTEMQAAAKATLIWVSHDLEQARRVSSRVWFLADGSLADCGTEDFFRRPPSLAAERFLSRQGRNEDAGEGGP